PGGPGSGAGRRSHLTDHRGGEEQSAPQAGPGSRTRDHRTSRPPGTMVGSPRPPGSATGSSISISGSGTGPRGDTIMVLATPPYANPLNSSSDPKAWWQNHRPIFVQTAPLGPVEKSQRQFNTYEFGASPRPGGASVPVKARLRSA